MYAVQRPSRSNAATVAAAQLGYRTHIYAPEESGPAADVSPRWTRGAYEDAAALAAFADGVDVVTYEFENIDPSAVDVLSTHGLVRPGALPRGQAGSDIVMIFTLCVPIFAVAGVVAEFGGLITGQASPGLWQITAVAVLGGLLASLAAVIVAFYSTVVAIRFGLDPDTYGIPMVTSSLDFVGAFTLILALVAVGVA